MNSACMEVEAEARAQIEARWAPSQSIRRVSVRAGFAYGGILAGFVLGTYEAALLYSRPPYSPMARPDLGPLIFLAAPLADVPVFGLVGLLLGYLAEKLSAPGKSYVRRFVSVGLGTVSAFVCGVTSLRFWWDKYPRMPLLVFLVVTAALGSSLLSSTVRRKWEARRGGFSAPDLEQLVRGLRWAALGVALILLSAVAAYEARRQERISPPPAQVANATARPNIILITLDTAAAAHFSSYGYFRGTTPNLDRFAKMGVQFDNAISPSSWTLPSFASLFTGLYPHQHGADFTSPLPEGAQTLASTLKRSGYQTAGFNSNIAYGQAGQGLSQGFDLYQAGAENLRQNLVETLFGRTFTKFIYLRFIRADRPERQDADELNRKVLRWFSHRSSRPYFLFINYFDVHGPYLVEKEYLNRFGGLPAGENQTAADTFSENERAVRSPADLASAIERYDDNLAYSDHQIGSLLEGLAKSPDWSNTVVIITSDHGEAFAEHGVMGHGKNLWRELVHVPLIIFGSGVPQGRRVPTVIATRRVYSMILSIAGATTKGPSGATSLRAYWSGEQEQDSSPQSIAVVSELGTSPFFRHLENTFISVTTPQWHWILDAHGQTQLYDWVKDPREQSNLANSPEAKELARTLRQAIRDRVMKTSHPWAGLDYLQPVGLATPTPIAPPERDALDSLPYQ